MKWLDGVEQSGNNQLPLKQTLLETVQPSLTCT